MGGPRIEVMVMEFNNAYEKFIIDNRYAGFEPAMLHAKAMAYARDKLQSIWPVIND